jgi:hypothetical protein
VYFNNDIVIKYACEIESCSMTLRSYLWTGKNSNDKKTDNKKKYIAGPLSNFVENRFSCRDCSISNFRKWSDHSLHHLIHIHILKFSILSSSLTTNSHLITVQFWVPHLHFLKFSAPPAFRAPRHILTNDSSRSVNFFFFSVFFYPPICLLYV